MSDDHNQMRSGYREAYEYLSNGGLPEVLALADAAHLPRTAAEYEARNHGSEAS